MARPRPVLPEVLSTIVEPGRSFPASSARRIMCTAIRSLREPVGLRCSIFTNTSAMPGLTMRLSFTIGVLPTRSRTVLAYFMPRPPAPEVILAANDSMQAANHPVHAGEAVHAHEADEQHIQQVTGDPQGQTAAR